MLWKRRGTGKKVTCRGAKSDFTHREFIEEITIGLLEQMDGIPKYRKAIQQSKEAKAAKTPKGAKAPKAPKAAA